MSSYSMNTACWFSRALACRYLVVRFDRMRVPTSVEGARGASEWHWALGLFADREFEVLGAWRDEGPRTPELMAADLHERGMEQIQSVVGAADVVAAMERFRPRCRAQSTAELVDSGAVGRGTARRLRNTDSLMARLQTSLESDAEEHGSFGDDAAVAEFLAEGFAQADRDVLQELRCRMLALRHRRAAFAAVRAD